MLYCLAISSSGVDQHWPRDNKNYNSVRFSKIILRRLISVKTILSRNIYVQLSHARASLQFDTKCNRLNSEPVFSPRFHISHFKAGVTFRDTAAYFSNSIFFLVLNIMFKNVIPNKVIMLIYSRISKHWETNNKTRMSHLLYLLTSNSNSFALTFCVNFVCVICLRKLIWKERM
jgi:hypothetical protein